MIATPKPAVTHARHLSRRALGTVLCDCSRRLVLGVPFLLGVMPAAVGAGSVKSGRWQEWTTAQADSLEGEPARRSNHRSMR
jgi:hypothetical protein